MNIKGKNKLNLEFNPSVGESRASSGYRMYGGEIEADGICRIKIRPFMILSPSDDILEHKDIKTLSNNTIISSKRSISLSFKPINKTDMLSVYPGKNSQYEVDQVKFQNYRKEKICCEVGCESNCQVGTEIVLCELSEVAPPSDYVKKEITYERWVTVYCSILDNKSIKIDTVYGVPAPIGSAERPNVGKAPGVKSIIIGDFKLRQYDSIINNEDIDYERRYAETVEEMQELISPVGGTISESIQTWMYDKRYLSHNKFNESTGMEEPGDYVKFKSNSQTPKKSITIYEIKYPADKDALSSGVTYTFNDATDRKGMLMYYNGFTGGERGFAIAGVYDSNPMLTCSSEDWGFFMLGDGCSNVCEVSCQSSCQSSCQTCQVSCECGHEYISGGRSYEVDPDDPLNLGTCINCDTSTDLTAGTYEYTSCPTNSDIVLSTCSTSCEGVPNCPTSYQNPCTVGCEVSCECSAENAGATCFACDSGNEGGHTPINTPCASNCEHGETCSTATETQNCDCMCNTLEENSCQLPAQTSCGSCETVCESCDSCQTCQVGCDNSDTPACVPVASCGITWDHVTALNDTATFTASYSPSNATTPISYTWSIVSGSGSISNKYSKTCQIKWTADSSNTKIKVVITNSCGTAQSILSIGHTGICTKSSSVTLSANKTKVCPGTSVKITPTVKPNSITNPQYRWDGGSWHNGYPVARNYTINNTRTIILDIQSKTCTGKKTGSVKVEVLPQLQESDFGNMQFTVLSDNGDTQKVRAEVDVIDRALLSKISVNNGWRIGSDSIYFDFVIFCTVTRYFYVSITGLLNRACGRVVRNGFYHNPNMWVK